jgi:hypothetical protein
LDASNADHCEPGSQCLGCGFSFGRSPLCHLRKAKNSNCMKLYDMVELKDALSSRSHKSKRVRRKPTNVHQSYINNKCLGCGFIFHRSPLLHLGLACNAQCQKYYDMPHLQEMQVLKQRNVINDVSFKPIQKKCKTTPRMQCQSAQHCLGCGVFFGRSPLAHLGHVKHAKCKKYYNMPHVTEIAAIAKRTRMKKYMRDRRLKKKTSRLTELDPAQDTHKKTSSSASLT